MPPCGIAAAWLPWAKLSGGVLPHAGTRTALQKELLLPEARHVLGGGERFLNLIRPLTENNFCWSQ